MEFTFGKQFATTIVLYSTTHIFYCFSNCHHTAYDMLSVMKMASRSDITLHFSS